MPKLGIRHKNLALTVGDSERSLQFLAKLIRLSNWGLEADNMIADRWERLEAESAGWWWWFWV